MTPEFKAFEGGDTRDVTAFNPHFQYNGQPWPQPPRYDRTKHTCDYFSSEDLGELNCLFDGLVHEGSIPATVSKLCPTDFNLSPGESIPDFRVTLTTGEEFFAEITSAGQQLTIREQETLNELSHALGVW